MKLLKVEKESKIKGANGRRLEGWRTKGSEMERESDKNEFRGQICHTYITKKRKTIKIHGYVYGL